MPASNQYLLSQIEVLPCCEVWEDRAEQVTWELYLWAAGMLSSRAFPDKLLRGRDDCSTMTGSALTYFSGGVRTNAENSKPALFPLLDILNHKPRTKITWVMNERGVGFTNEEEVLYEGAEVFNNYGPKPNEQCE